MPTVRQFPVGASLPDRFRHHRFRAAGAGSGAVTVPGSARGLRPGPFGKRIASSALGSRRHVDACPAGDVGTCAQSRPDETTTELGGSARADCYLRSPPTSAASHASARDATSLIRCLRDFRDIFP